MVQHLVQRAVAEDRQPRQGETERNQQHAEYEFADGAAARDARDEQAHERRPADPPGPVEHRPAAQPFRPAAVGVDIETLADHAAQVIAQVLHERTEQVLGGAGAQHEQHQRDGQQHVDVGHPAHALFHAGHRHRHRGAHHAGHQDDLHQVGVRHVEQVGQAGVEVQHAKAHVGTDAEHGGDDAQCIHCVADGPVDALADERVQRRAQRQRQVVAVGEVGHRHRRQREHAPAMQAPVQEQQLHGLARTRLAGGRIALWWLQVMGQRFGDAEEEQGDADAGGKQHAGPRQIAEFRFVMVGPQLDAAVLGQRDADHEHQVQGHRQQVVPAHVERGPVLRLDQQAAGAQREQADEQCEGNDDDRREGENGPEGAHRGVLRLQCFHRQPSPVDQGLAHRVCMNGSGRRMKCGVVMTARGQATRVTRATGACTSIKPSPCSAAFSQPSTGSALQISGGPARTREPSAPLPPVRRCTAPASRAGCPGRPRWWWCTSRR